MSVIILIFVVAAIYAIARMGALALEMTGLEQATARFEALSAVTGTGFTTRESELVVGHPRRRRIITYLILVGNAGLVSMVSALVLSLKSDGYFWPAINLGIIILSLLILYKLANRIEVTHKFNQKLRRFVYRKLGFENTHIEEILSQGKGQGLASVLLGDNSPVAGKALKESGFRDKGLLVLSVERDGETETLASADTMLRPGDRVLCYGEIKNLKGFV